MFDLLSMLIGAIIGQGIEVAFKQVAEKSKRWHNKKQEKELVKQKELTQNTPQIAKWLIAYYEKKGHLNDLYDCAIGNFETKIPFLTKEEWLCNIPVNLLESTQTNFIEFKHSDKKFDTNLEEINKLEKQGYTLFPNSSALYLDKIEHNNIESKLVFHVKPCLYYQILTNIKALENETFSAIKKDRYDETVIRDAYISEVHKAKMLNRKPFGLGCAILLALKTQNGYEVIIHKRADTLLTYPNAKAVIPNFGIVPIMKNETETETENKNLLLYNFLKEYLEELFNYEELIDQASYKKINPFWFYDHCKEAKNVLSAIGNNRLKMTLLGFGFDCLNGVPILSLLSVIDDKNVIDDLTKNSELNWEGKAIYFLDINKKENQLKSWLEKAEYHPGAAFTISRALSFLKNQ